MCVTTKCLPDRNFRMVKKNLTTSRIGPFIFRSLHVHSEERLSVCRPMDRCSFLSVSVILLPFSNVKPNNTNINFKILSKIKNRSTAGDTYC